MKGRENLVRFLQMISRVEVPDFDPTRVAVVDEGKSDEAEAVDPKDGDTYDALVAELSGRELPKKTLPSGEEVVDMPSPAEFEKDDDTNYHIDFCTAAANCRAMCYGLPLSERTEVKSTVGRIVPALATTTAFATGNVLGALYQVMHGRCNPSDFLAAAVNIGTHNWTIYQAMDPVAFSRSQYFKQKYKSTFDETGAWPDCYPTSATTQTVIKVEAGPDASFGDVLDKLVDLIALPEGAEIMGVPFGTQFVVPKANNRRLPFRTEFLPKYLRLGNLGEIPEDQVWFELKDIEAGGF